jgi:hypothetical protein
MMMASRQINLVWGSLPSSVRLTIRLSIVQAHITYATTDAPSEHRAA